MSVETYNGWANYPSWAVATWLGNEESSYSIVHETVSAWERRTADKGGTLTELADALRDVVDELPEIEAPRAEANLASDLLGFALACVDWHELAQVYALDAVPGDSAYERVDEINRRRTVYLETLRQPSVRPGNCVRRKRNEEPETPR